MDNGQFTIIEWNYTNKLAFDALTRFVGSHTSAFHTFTLIKGYAGSNENFLMDNPYIEVKITPYMMARIVDLEKFLITYPFKHQDSFEFSLTIEEDFYAPWNVGTYILSKQNNQLVKVVKQDKLDQATISGSIQTMTQALLGYQSVENLAFYHRLTGNVEVLTAFSNAVVPAVPVLDDYF